MQIFRENVANSTAKYDVMYVQSYGKRRTRTYHTHDTCVCVCVVCLLRIPYTYLTGVCIYGYDTKQYLLLLHLLTFLFCHC